MGGQGTRTADVAARPPAMSAPARVAFGAVRLYQRLTDHRASPCRYIPSCSNYALDALERHGAGRGSWLALRRLCRCHPWSASGFDPVPERK